MLTVNITASSLRVDHEVAVSVHDLPIKKLKKKVTKKKKKKPQKTPRTTKKETIKFTKTSQFIGASTDQQEIFKTNNNGQSFCYLNDFRRFNLLKIKKKKIKIKIK